MPLCVLTASRLSVLMRRLKFVALVMMGCI
jgi:hypothetical protein